MADGLFHLGEKIPGRRFVTPGGHLHLCADCAAHERNVRANGGGGCPYVNASKKKFAKCAFCGKDLRAMDDVEAEAEPEANEDAWIWPGPADNPLSDAVRARIRLERKLGIYQKDVCLYDADRVGAAMKIRLEYIRELSEREREILCCRYGLAGYKHHTLIEAGNRFNVSRERVRQIEQKALRKLRNILARREAQEACGGLVEAQEARVAPEGSAPATTSGKL